MIVSFSYPIFQKAKGDIKKKGKPDPYAYVPLHFQSLNKRYVWFCFVVNIMILLHNGFSISDIVICPRLV